jgi:hypothetical protein
MAHIKIFREKAPRGSADPRRIAERLGSRPRVYEVADSGYLEEPISEKN